MNRINLTSASFAILLCLVTAANAVTLAPHRAFYDLEVKRLDQGNNISSIRGKLAYEITGSRCDGYAVNYRIANRIMYNEGQAQLIDTQMTSWESGDGLEIDMTQKQFVDSKLNSESRIKVKKDRPDAAGKGQIITAVTKPFETAPSAVFPTLYQLRLIEAALKGNSRDEALVYEGSDDDKTIKAISFIGARKPVAGLPASGGEALGSLAAWPVSISYYPLAGEGDDQPVYQATFMMLENGISTDLVLDYGSYALSGKLSKLEMLKPETCN